MSDYNWHPVADRLSTQGALDLDQTIWPGAKQQPKGGDLGRQIPEAETVPSTMFWPLANTDQTNIGIRITTPLKDPVALAATLVAMAIERDVTPVIMSYISDCGLAQFGMRIEMIAGKTDAERLLCEQELAQFFHIAIVLNAENLSALM